MKWLALCSFVIVLALMGFASAQNRFDVIPQNLSGAPYRVGERLTYNISFSNFISAGHVELYVVNRGSFYGREAIQLRAHVETTGVVSAALYAINNDYITYVDPQTGLPFQAQQIVREATRTSDTARTFNQPVAQMSDASNSKNSERPVFDFLSAIYRLRALPLAEGSTHPLYIKADDDYHLQLKITGHETVRTNVGSFNAIAGQISVTNNSRANGYRTRIFFSDDDRHLPVLITARLSAGELRAELAGVEYVKPASIPTPATTVAPPPIANQPTVSLPPAVADANSDLANLPFKVGEQLTYQVFLGDVPQPAGSATFHVRSRSRFFERDGLLFLVRAQTNDAAQKLFIADDRISSYVDAKTLLPYRTEMNLIEGTRRFNQILTINQDHGVVTTDKGQRIEIPVGTHDYISFFYLARTFSLTPTPKRTAVSILVNNKIKTLFVNSIRREPIQLGSQTIPAILVSLTTDDPQGDKFQLKAWVSDDNRRLPLRLTAMTDLGAVRADLAIVPLTAQ